MSAVTTKKNISNDIHLKDYNLDDRINEWQKQVSKIINDISIRNKSFYQELFYFYPNTMTFKQVSKKFLFKIQKIIEFECQKAPFSIQIATQNDARENSRDFIKDNNHFFIKLKISFIKDSNIIHCFDSSLLWNAKNTFNKKNQKLHHISEALKIIGKINKRDFQNFPNGKQYHLLNFLQGMLENISPNFLIDFDGENITREISCPNESKFKVFYNKQAIFNFVMYDDEVHFFCKNCQPSSWQKKNITTTAFMTNQWKTLKKWKMIAKILRINFSKMWNRSDSIYEIVKTVNHLLGIMYGQRFVETVFITASFPHQTKLWNLWLKNPQQNALNFHLYFNSYNFKMEISNIKFNAIQINPKIDFYN